MNAARFFRHALLASSLVTAMAQGEVAAIDELGFSVPQGEGGSISLRARQAFEHHMKESECPVRVESRAQNDEAGEIVFSVMPASAPYAAGQPVTARLTARTYENTPLTATVLVKASTGVNSLESLEGERLALVSKTSVLGFVPVRELFADAGVDFNEGQLFITGSYEGAITLLLHGDVFAAALPAPLSARWAKANGLSMVAQSLTPLAGYVTISDSLAESRRQACVKALQSLERSSARDKRMDVFPVWVEGFRHEKTAP
ncbi:PhnD/SsuA/transferrin family substrate-binding protein [Marinobacter halophilus]|uniref:Uncharacterized protein n=1 Tax=Marinobacter halophilus TaxID=1323740 RepID=A0A2T1KEC9_9GAMM|nr:PhnD/SsuA/transferrin family substrate-binding protein [Marinobacter halophilus]PSF08481.1 hypothetical protein C7H08_07280 [Marinobacter halophilus]GGC60971.1 hypothetical protein GCM10011362_06810 [Marinobacter halophilus]